MKTKSECSDGKTEIGSNKYNKFTEELKWMSTQEDKLKEVKSKLRNRDSKCRKWPIEQVFKGEKDKTQKLEKSLVYYKDKARRHIKDLIVDKDEEIELL